MKGERVIFGGVRGDIRQGRGWGLLLLGRPLRGAARQEHGQQQQEKQSLACAG